MRKDLHKKFNTYLVCASKNIANAATSKVKLRSKFADVAAETVVTQVHEPGAYWVEVERSEPARVVADLVFAALLYGSCHPSAPA